MSLEHWLVLGLFGIAAAVLAWLFFWPFDEGDDW